MRSGCLKQRIRGWIPCGETPNKMIGRPRLTSPEHSTYAKKESANAELYPISYVYKYKISNVIFKKLYIAIERAN